MRTYTIIEKSPDELVDTLGIGMGDKPKLHTLGVKWQEDERWYGFWIEYAYARRRDAWNLLAEQLSNRPPNTFDLAGNEYGSAHVIPIAILE